MSLVNEADLLALIAADRWMMRAFEVVRSLALPDWWIVAGFVRNKVWDTLHGYRERSPINDVDVVYFDRGREAAVDREIEAELRALDGGYPWEVYNQAHMHVFNRDAPYASAVDSFARWAETVSTVGVTLTSSGELELTAPCGIDDLVAMVVRPNPHPDAQPDVFEQRLASKGWLERWPKARIVR